MARTPGTLDYFGVESSTEEMLNQLQEMWKYCSTSVGSVTAGMSTEHAYQMLMFSMTAMQNMSDKRREKEKQLNDAIIRYVEEQTEQADTEKAEQLMENQIMRLGALQAEIDAQRAQIQNSRAEFSELHKVMIDQINAKHNTARQELIDSTKAALSVQFQVLSSGTSALSKVPKDEVENMLQTLHAHLEHGEFDQIHKLGFMPSLGSNISAMITKHREAIGQIEQVRSRELSQAHSDYRKKDAMYDHTLQNLDHVSTMIKDAIDSRNDLVDIIRERLQQMREFDNKFGLPHDKGQPGDAGSMEV